MWNLTLARDLRQPLFDLEKSGLVRIIRATAANRPPLAAEERESLFKVQLVEIGLMLNMLGMDLGSRPLGEALFANEGHPPMPAMWNAALSQIGVNPRAIAPAASIFIN